MLKLFFSNFNFSKKRILKKYVFLNFFCDFVTIIVFFCLLILEKYKIEKYIYF
jgi:hypothetical protein